ncbi:TonB-dependent siderophore receptor [Halarcobacter ebronensis]|uniref:TonB-dependent siderophore receptor n=1 Tax=Halarcobacter ebronensis TaxID=1462615 RepID=A0A4Q1ARN5_9BACT|nr:TonB-dependent receptor [Halarcobacter ebronensis]QKF82192.1 TonB-dependent siderophore receptor [Halarcobacter ebronensis]RXK03430.1 TonB-dependent siderophore receptor [Halarcobacter ebronensis]
MNKKLIMGLTIPLCCTLLNASEELDDVTVVGIQNSYYEENSSTALKSDSSDKETPYSTTTTNKTLIDDLQALRLEDTYDYTTGVTKIGQSADSITIRGFDIDLQNIQVDGLPGLISRFGSPSTANVEKVEILKGPASVLYGNMEAGGFVNIITKKPQAENKVTIETSYHSYLSNSSKLGEDNGFTTSVDATGTITNGLYYRFIAVGENIDSYRGNVGNKNLYVYPSLLWDIDDNTSLLLALEYGKEDGDADDGLFVANHDIATAADITTVYQDDGDYDNDEGTAINLNLEHYFVNNSVLNVSWRSVFHNDERALNENRTVNQAVNVEDTTLTRRHRDQSNDRDWHSFDANLKFKAYTGSIVHNLTTGVSGAYRETDYDRIAFGGNLTPNINIYNPSHVSTYTSVEGNRRKTEYLSGAIYAQDKMNLTDDLIFVTSGRVDRTKINYYCLRGSCADDNTTYSTNFVGSLGLVYNINPFVSVYGSFGQSYNPETAERVDVDGNGLDSEKSKQYEVGAKFNINEKLNTTLSFYKINKENVAESNGSYYVLTGEVESKGIELDVQWLPTENWQFKAGYALNNAEYVAGSSLGEKPSNTPRNTAFVFTRYNIPTRVFNGVLGLTSGVTYKDSVFTSSSESTRVELPSYARLDLGVHYDEKDWSLSLNVQNVADKKYYEYGSNDYSIYSGEPRKIVLTFKKSF